MPMTADEALQVLQGLEVMLADAEADATAAEMVMHTLEQSVRHSADGWPVDDLVAVQTRLQDVLQCAITRRAACMEGMAHQSAGRRASSRYGGQP
jgi:hypothetical protein